VKLAQTRGRFLAEPVVAGIGFPRPDCGVMDGYAVRAEDIAGNRTSLRAVDTRYATDLPMA